MSPVNGPFLLGVVFLLMASWSAWARGDELASDRAYLPMGVWGCWWALSVKAGLAILVNLAALTWVAYKLADDKYERPLVVVRP